MSAHDRTGVGAGTAEWETPPDLFRALDRRYQFDYDAFASHDNALCELYSTAEGTFRKVGPRLDGPHHAEAGDGDGLTFDWTNLRVFMNPPYSRELIEQCIRKAYEERNNAALIVALVPAATETRWFQDYILPWCHIDWLPRRVRYIHPPFACAEGCDHRRGEPGPSPPSGAVVATFKTDLQGAPK